MINRIEYNNKAIEFYEDDKFISSLPIDSEVEKVLVKAILNYEGKKYLRFIDENEIIR